MLEKVESKYALESPTYRCVSCDGEVSPGSGYVSAVLLDEESFLRNEYCSPCWDGQPPREEGLYAFWRTRRPVPPGERRRRRRFDLDVLWGFFLKLEERLYGRESDPTDPDPSAADEKSRLHFLIALLLVRGKRLVLESSARRDGSEWLKLSEKGQPGAIHLVRNPEIGAEDLERVKESLGALLEMEL